MRLYKDKARIYDLFIQKTGRDYKEIILFIKQYLKKGDRILEIGAGTGEASLAFKNEGFDIECSDVNKGVLEIARKKGLHCFQADMRNFNTGKKFDVVLSLFNTLMYNTSLEDLKNNLQSCYNAINPDGKLIIEIVNPELLLSKARSFSHLWKLNDKEWLIQIDEIKNKLLLHEFIIINLDNNELVVDKHKTIIFTTEEIERALNITGFRKVEKMNKRNSLYFIAHK